MFYVYFVGISYFSLLPEISFNFFKVCQENSEYSRDLRAAGSWLT